MILVVGLKCTLVVAGYIRQVSNVYVFGVSDISPLKALAVFVT